jgi:hypothetical protein
MHEVARFAAAVAALGCVGLAAGQARAAEPKLVEVDGPEPKLTVVLDKPAGATLLRENSLGWGSVCEAPCVARLPRGGSFVINVPGSKKTGRLDLRDSPGKVRLRLIRPSQGELVAGSILAYVGGTIAPIGLIVLTAGVITGKPGVLLAGVGITGVAGIGLGLGIPLMVSNSHTAVVQEPVAQGLRLVGSF